MTKQNRVLGFTGLFVGIILILILFMSGKIFNQTPMPWSKAAIKNSEPVAHGGVGPVPEQMDMGDPIEVLGLASDSSSEQEKVFSEILSDLLVCLDLKTVEVAAKTPLAIDSIIALIQSQLGPSTHLDRWVQWYLRDAMAAEKRLRLEITETDDGQMRRELQSFGQDNEGQIISFDLPPERAHNPTDDMINQALKEGEVFRKEKAGTVLFMTGEHFEYTERDGLLSEFEFVRSGAQFRCASLKKKSSCQCVR